MRTFASLVLLFSLASAIPAFAEESCSTTAYYKVATSYPYADFDLDAANGAVGQGGLTRSCGPWSYDFWTSVGHGGLANEVDLSVFYTRNVGPVRVQVSGQYYLVNLHHSLLDSKDDILELYADVSYPLTFGQLTVAPLARFVRVVGIEELQSQTLLQPGVRLSFQATSRVNANLDLRDSDNITVHHEALRYEGVLSYQADDRTSFQFGVKGAAHTRAAFSVGFSHQF